MAKVTCESCGSSFPLDRVKDMKNCPVCGDLWDEDCNNDVDNETVMPEKKEDNVRCKSCGMSYKYDLAKTLTKCRACGRPLWDEKSGNANGVNLPKVDESEKGLMYFDEIATTYKEHPDYNGVRTYCSECGEGNSLELNKFEKLVDKEYVILKGNYILKCRGCGKEHKPRKILYKKKDHYAPPLPRCPVCNSAMLKKITTGSKVLAAATIGMYALPYNSKTFECKDCGYRF